MGAVFPSFRRPVDAVRARVVFPRGGCFRAGGYRKHRAEQGSSGEVSTLAMAEVPASSGQKGSEEHRIMLFMASGSSPRCSFQLRAQIQTVVEVFVSKLGFEGKRDGGAHGLVLSCLINLVTWIYNFNH